MIGAFKCCGARVLRSVATPLPTLETTSNKFGVQPCIFDCGHLNWSQRRFLRGQSSSTPGGPESETISGSTDTKDSVTLDLSLSLSIPDAVETEGLSTEEPTSKNEQSLSQKKYSRSMRGLQSCLISTLPKAEIMVEQLVNEISKIIVENGVVAIRVKTRKDEELVKEWIGVQNEIQKVKHDRIEDDRRKLHIAGQEVLKEMARLTKSMNLDELDQAIEGALCSQAKSDYSQQKTSHDN